MYKMKPTISTKIHKMIGNDTYLSQQKIFEIISTARSQRHMNNYSVDSKFEQILTKILSKAFELDGVNHTKLMSCGEIQFYGRPAPCVCQKNVLSHVQMNWNVWKNGLIQFAMWKR